MSRLELDAGGKVLVDDRDAITTVLVARAEFCDAQRTWCKKCVAAHRELTDWIKANPAEAQRWCVTNSTPKPAPKFSPELVASGLEAHRADNDMSLDALKRFVASAQSSAFCAMRRICRDLAKCHEPRLRGDDRAGASSSSSTCRNGFARRAPHVRRSTTSTCASTKANSSAWSARAAAARSTLLDIIAGLTKPDRGRVLADDQLVDGPGPPPAGDVPGVGAVSLAQRVRQRDVRAQAQAGPDRPRAPGDRRAIICAWSGWRNSQRLCARAVGRHEAARRAGALRWRPIRACC